MSFSLLSPSLGRETRIIKPYIAMVEGRAPPAMTFKGIQTCSAKYRKVFLHRLNRFTGRGKGRGVYALTLGISFNGLLPSICLRFGNLAGFGITQSLGRFPCRCAEVLFTLFIPANTAMKLERNNLVSL